ncbi:MAG: type II toxin-antitoxin system VapC family toxin [Gemmatimonadales bacterium]|nr:type II toxin-antitoxin system VapC family toxin [Gemmatimonadales bacterium]
MASRKQRRTPGAPAEPTLTWYIESSALLAAVLEADLAAREAIRARGRRITSSLTLAEAHRAVLRARLDGRLSGDQERSIIRGLQTFARRCELVAISEEVLTRAGRPFPVEPVRTLDAIHLASVELLGEPPQLVTVITRDSRVAGNARALGFTVA